MAECPSVCLDMYVYEASLHKVLGTAIAVFGRGRSPGNRRCYLIYDVLHRSALNLYFDFVITQPKVFTMKPHLKHIYLITHTHTRSPKDTLSSSAKQEAGDRWVSVIYINIDGQ